MLVPANADCVYRDSPYIAEYHNFLDPAQCQQIIDLWPQLAHTQGGVYVDNHAEIDLDRRLAQTHKISDHDPEILTQFASTVASWLQLPNNQWIEHTLLVHYPQGGYFDLHTDQISNTCSQGKTTNRVATVIVYLNDNFDGGYTVFPTLRALVKPQTGKALFFRYDYANQNLNKLTDHAGGRVSDSKYILVCFVRDNEYPDELRALANY